MKITDIETKVDEIPMISGVVNFAKINQKKYPKKIPAIASIKRYAALLPTSILLKFFHLFIFTKNMF